MPGIGIPTVPHRFRSGKVGDGHRRRFGQAVPLEDRDAERGEELGELPREGDAPADEETEAAAEAGANLREHEGVRDPPLRFEEGPDAPSLAPASRHVDSDRQRPVEDRGLRLPAFPCLLEDLRVHLLEDARDDADERGPHGREIRGDAVDAAVDGRGKAEGDPERHAHLSEDVGQRQPQELKVGRPEEAERADRLDLEEPAVVRQLDALRAAGRPGRVDERREVRRPGGRSGGVEAARMRRIPRAAESREIEEGHRVARQARGRVEQDEMAEAGKRVAAARDPPRLVGVLREHDRGPRVGQDERRVFLGRDGIDRRRDASGAGDGEVREDPLEACGRDDGHAIAGRELEGQEPAGELARARCRLAPRQALPGAFLGMEERGRVRRRLHAGEEEIRDRAVRGRSHGIPLESLCPGMP